MTDVLPRGATIRCSGKMMTGSSVDHAHLPQVWQTEMRPRRRLREWELLGVILALLCSLGPSPRRSERLPPLRHPDPMMEFYKETCTGHI